MSFETVRAITDNLRSVLRAEGIQFQSSRSDDDHAVPASLLPLGRVFYSGESFEYAHGQRAGYAEVEYRVRVVLSERDAEGRVSEQQKWGHRIRETLVVDALNAGELAVSRPVSRVFIAGIETTPMKGRPSLNCRVVVRYRLN